MFARRVKAMRTDPLFDEVADLVRRFPPDPDLMVRVQRSIRKATANCTATTAVSEAIEHFLAEFALLSRDAEEDRNISRKTDVLSKLETVRLLCR